MKAGQLANANLRSLFVNDFIWSEALLSHLRHLRFENILDFLFYLFPQIRNPTKVSERCGPNRQECDFSSLD